MSSYRLSVSHRVGEGPFVSCVWTVWWRLAKPCSSSQTRRLGCVVVSCRLAGCPKRVLIFLCALVIGLTTLRHLPTGRLCVSCRRPQARADQLLRRAPDFAHLSRGQGFRSFRRPGQRCPGAGRLLRCRPQGVLDRKYWRVSPSALARGLPSGLGCLCHNRRRAWLN